MTAPDPVRAGRALGGAAAGILVLEGLATLFVPRGIAQTGEGLTGGRLIYLLVLALVLILAAGVQRRPQGVLRRHRLCRSPLLLTGLFNSVMWFVAGVFVLIWLYLLQVRKELLGSPVPSARRARRAVGRRRAAHPVGCRPVTERTLVLVKPDGVARGLVGEVITRLERKGLRLVAAELRTLSRETAETHYAEHSERPFFGSLVEFITSGPLMALVVEGPRAIEAFRALAGATDPVKALPGHDPRRLRPRGAEQHRARLGLARVGRARGRRSSSPTSPDPLGASSPISAPPRQVPKSGVLASDGGRDGGLGVAATLDRS